MTRLMLGDEELIAATLPRLVAPARKMIAAVAADSPARP
jgi:hypothetical protein